MSRACQEQSDHRLGSCSAGLLRDATDGCHQDEATSSVDVETDSKLQKTIQTEFAHSTLLCIAHRLNTICYYDRILVMDAGHVRTFARVRAIVFTPRRFQVAEYDTPLNLFDKEDSIFRSLCNEARLSREDIVRIRAGVTSDSSVAE